MLSYDFYEFVNSSIDYCKSTIDKYNIYKFDNNKSDIKPVFSVLQLLKMSFLFLKRCQMM